ncbi:hypothetical protein AAC387_Pa03g2909 [Persea americana]
MHSSLYFTFQIVRHQLLRNSTSAPERTISPGQSRKFIMKQGHYSLSFLLSFKILAPCPAPLPSPLSILYFPPSGGEDTNEERRRFSFSLLSSEIHFVFTFGRI